MVNLRRKKASDPLVRDNFDLSSFQNQIPVGTWHYSENPVDNQGDREEFLERVDTYSKAASLCDSDEQRTGAESDRSRKASPSLLCEDFVKVKNGQGVWLTFVWPAIAICVPMVLLNVALIYICHKFQIDQGESVFGVDESTRFKGRRYMLVNFPATKLVFLASFLSTLAPLLAGCIMNLVAVLVYHELEEISDVEHFTALPTPYQISLLIGILAASYEQLFSSFAYLLSSKRAEKVSPVLKYAISIFLLTVMLDIAVAATDAFLHIATQTVSVTIYSPQRKASGTLGKGINSYCLNVNRTANLGYPCTYAKTTTLGKTAEWQDGQAEIQRIVHDSSTQSSVHMDTSGNIAYLISATIPNGIDFTASTVGIRGKCSLLDPSVMNIKVWGDYSIYTSFNYSSNFWGTLGLTPPEAALGAGKALSPYLAFLAINQNANLIYNYFADSALSIVYNTADLDATASSTNTSRPWSDAELKNPVYLGLAWRTATSSFAGFSKNGMVSSDLVHKYQAGSFIDYFLRCELTSYNVTYTVRNGTTSIVDAVKHENGTILNMWTGMAAYYPRISASDFDLQDYNIQSAIAGNTSETYLTQFGDLLGQRALATIGAFTSSREVLQEQEYRTMLVAKVPISALGALLACSFLYPVLGSLLLVKALRASKKMGPIAPLFSYWGLTWAAFLQNCQESTQDITDVDKPTQFQEDALRVIIRKNKNSESRFVTYKRSSTGQITEIERSEAIAGAWI